MKRIYPLHVHVSTVFLIIVLMMGGVTAWVGYKYSRDMLETSATDLTLRISDRLLKEMQGILEPADLAISVLSHDSEGEERGLKQRWQRLDLISEVLAHSANFAAVYAGYENGDFFMVRPLLGEEERL